MSLTSEIKCLNLLYGVCKISLIFYVLHRKNIDHYKVRKKYKVQKRYKFFNPLY